MDIKLSSNKHLTIYYARYLEDFLDNPAKYNYYIEDYSHEDYDYDLTHLTDDEFNLINSNISRANKEDDSEDMYYGCSRSYEVEPLYYEFYTCRRYKDRIEVDITINVINVSREFDEFGSYQETSSDREDVVLILKEDRNDFHKIIMIIDELDFEREIEDNREFVSDNE